MQEKTIEEVSFFGSEGLIDKEDDNLSEVLGELGVEGVDDILLKVYKADDMGKDAHIFDCLPDAVIGIEDRLRKSYGKGDFKIKVFTPTPKGGKSVKKTVKLSIDVPLDSSDENQNQNSKKNEDNFKGMLELFVSEIQSLNKDTLEMMQRSALEAQVKHQEMMMQLLGNKSEPSVSIVEQLALLKQIMPEPQPQLDPMDMLDKMMSMHRTVKDEFAGGGEESTIGELTKGLNSLVSAAVNAPNKGVYQNQNQNQRNEGDMKNPLIQMKLRGHLDLLAKKAAENKDVDLWVDLTLDEVPDEYYPLLIEALGDSDEAAFLKFMNINPIIVNHKEWFISFFQKMREAFTVEEVMVDDKIDADLTGGELVGEDQGK